MAYSRSIELEKAQNYLGAIKAISDLNDSVSYENNLRLGWLYFKAGLKKKSMRFYELAINLQPKAIEPRIGYGFPAYQLEDYDDLIMQDKKILEIDPNNKATNANLGLIYYYGKDYKNALPYFQKVVELYPFDYDNNLTLGWCYLALDKKAEAEKHFNTVLLYSPQDVSAKDGLNQIGQNSATNQKTVQAFSKSYEFASQSNNAESISALKEVYDKTSYALNLRLGWLCYLAGMHKEAVEYYKIAAELKPKAIEAKLGLALPTEAMGNKNELVGIYETILVTDPHNTPVLFKLGKLYYQKKEYVSAYKYIEKLVTLYPFDYDGLLMFAWTNYQMGKTAESRTLFNKVLCIAPGDKSAVNGLNSRGIEEEKKLQESKKLIQIK